MTKLLKKMLILLLFASCSTNDKKNYSLVEGSWEITKFYYEGKIITKENDLTLDDYYIISFEEINRLSLLKDVNRERKRVYSHYKLFKKNDTLKIDIIKCKDSRLNGNYDVYIDTVAHNREQYMIRLSLDNEKTYIEALRPKLKYQ